MNRVLGNRSGRAGEGFGGSVVFLNKSWRVYIYRMMETLILEQQGIPE